jgi:transposase
MKSLEFKLAATRCYKILNSLRKTANIFNVSHTTIKRWKDFDFNKPSIKNSKYIEREKLHSEMISAIKNIAKDNPFQTHSSFRSKLQEVFGISISKNLCNLMLHKSKVTRKKVRFHYLTKCYHEKLVKFKNEIFDISKNVTNNMIFVDETSIKSNLFPLYGYSEVGVTINKRKKVSSKNTSAIVAISENGIVHSSFVNGSVKSSDFVI